MADVNHSMQISAKPQDIYPLVAAAKGFAAWWAADLMESDGAVALGFFNRATIYRLRLKVDQPPTRAEWVCETGDEWNGTRIAFQLEAAKPGALLRFTHADWRSPSDYFISCNTTWGGLMFRLKAAAEGKAPGPLFSADGMAY
jgi:hypothetical protein